MMKNDINEVLEFIDKRFPIDCNWLSGNCYYFAKILQARFPTGEIYYDLIRGHFLFKYNNCFYDWSGICKVNYLDIVEWDTYNKIDPLHSERIIRDCIF